MYEGVLAIWYDLWLVVVGFGASVVLTLAIIARTEWRGNGLVVAIVMVFAVLAGLPLTMMLAIRSVPSGPEHCHDAICRAPSDL